MAHGDVAHASGRPVSASSERTDERLRTLLVDESPVVRVYAFYAFSDRRAGRGVVRGPAWQGGRRGADPTLDGCIYDRHTIFERMLEHVEHRLSPAQSKELRELHERMKHGSRP